MGLMKMMNVTLMRPILTSMSNLVKLMNMKVLVRLIWLQQAVLCEQL